MQNEKKMSSYAIISFTLGIISFMIPIIPAIPAVILGHMAVSSINKNPNIEGKIFARIGLILGYINFGLFILLMIIVLFAGSEQKELVIESKEVIITDNVKYTP